MVDLDRPALPSLAASSPGALASEPSGAFRVLGWGLVVILVGMHPARMRAASMMLTAEQAGGTRAGYRMLQVSEDSVSDLSCRLLGGMQAVAK